MKEKAGGQGGKKYPFRALLLASIGKIVANFSKTVLSEFELKDAKS